jgi:hypothetical protein
VLPCSPGTTLPICRGARTFPGHRREEEHDADLCHVLLEVRKAGQLVVTATDLDLAVSSEHSSEVLKKHVGPALRASLRLVLRAGPPPVSS